MPGFLVVDDSPTIRLSLRAAIRNVAGSDAVVHEADGGQAALALFQKEKPDVVFLDLVLGSGQFGNQVMDAILRQAPETRIVVVSGLPATDAKVVDAVSKGAFAHVPKPVRTDAIRKVLDELDVESGAAPKAAKKR